MKPETPKNLGTILQSQREQKGLTQMQVARKLNVTKSLISKIENGQVRIPVFRLVQYCIVIEIHIADIANEIEAMFIPPINI